MLLTSDSLGNTMSLMIAVVRAGILSTSSKMFDQTFSQLFISANSKSFQDDW